MVHVMDIHQKTERIITIIKEHAPLVISYSGGVDSTLLAVLARESVGADQIVCVFIDGAEVPRRAVSTAKTQAESLKLPLVIRQGIPLSYEVQQSNPHDRCKSCKLKTFPILREIGDEFGYKTIADGANASDVEEYRPGIDASSSCGIIHPFIMAGITKEDIRMIAFRMGYAFWNKPSSACLYSRIPYGEEITNEKLRMIEKGEELLQNRGIQQARVRHHGTIARIEVMPDDMETILLHREEISLFFKNLGFSYITLDLQGYRSGSMDEALHFSS